MKTIKVKSKKSNYSKTHYSKKLLAAIVFMMIHSLSQAQTIANEINKGLKDVALPIVGLSMIMGTIIGLVRNYHQINDANTKKQGLIDAGIIVLYSFIISGAISTVIIIYKTLNITV